MKKAATLLMIALLMMTLIPLFTGNAQAGESAKLDRVEVSASPPQQGAGGEIEVTATVYIYGGCCYHLYTYDLTATADFPEEVEILNGPSPKIYKEVDGLPGGEPVTRKFTWTVRCFEEGVFPLKVVVDTENSGSVSGQCDIMITKGAVISVPQLYPSKAETGRHLHMKFKAYSPIEAFEVTEVRMYYYFSSQQLTNLSANNSVLTIESGGELNTITGTELTLTPSTLEENIYTTTIPAIDKEGYFYYWIYAVDTEDMRVTTAVYESQLTDYEKANSVVRYVFIALIVFAIVGIILIVLLHAYTGKRQVRDKTKLYRLGSMGNTEFMEETDRPKDPKPVLLYVVIALIVLIAIGFIIYSFYTGSYDEIVTHLREGK